MAAWQKLMQALQREPTLEEVALDTGMDVDTVRYITQVGRGATVHFGDEWGDEAEDEGGVVLPSPAAPLDVRLLSQEHLQERSQALIRLLGPENGPKWLILHLLHEYEPFAYEWPEIARFLADASAEIAPLWKWVSKPLAGVVPRE